MNRYPVWKYAILVVALLVGVLYTLPNFFGEAPAVQVSSAKATVKVDAAVMQRVEEALRSAGLSPDYVSLEGTSVRARFDTPDNQLKAKDAIQRALVPDAADPSYIVALNLVSRSPTWLNALHAQPMYLGLDLRGGVHFMLQVDMQAALTKKAESLAGDLRTALRDKNIRHGGISRDGQAIDIRVRDEATLTAARNLIADQFPDLLTTSSPDGEGFQLRATIKPEALRKVHRGGRSIDPQLALDAWSEADPLNDRERQVLRLAGEGRSAGEIASQLSLSQGTVRNYLSEAIGKLGVGNRIEAFRLARQKGWL